MGGLFDTEGRVWLRGALSFDQIAALDRRPRFAPKPGERRRTLPGIETVDALAEKLLPEARPVRVIAFNKSKANNWTLPWHQDRVVALRERVEMPGFGNWTNKAGI